MHAERGQQVERIGHWQRLLAQAIRRDPVDGGVRVELPVALAGEVVALAVPERGAARSR